MDEELWERADALLDAALELPAVERPAYVEAGARGDAELEALVRRLLRNAEETGTELVPGLRLDRSPAEDLIEDEEEISPPGTVIGRYRILGELGRGGMAVVYRAERTDGDFEHQVALKQILGPAGSRLARRLEQERQILARASHPDVARLLDGGVDDRGRPYLVMELVDGVPVDEYCDRERLTVRERLRLFLRIARAVEDAHSNLVVHRDIKPSNVLVTAAGHPKLLDFGIARLLESAESEAGPTLTRHGAQPMTPAYASPEQLRAEPVTTLSDVYQLGLLLYLLLTGRTPYGPESSGSPLERARVISESPPVRPHRALAEPATGEAATAEEIANRRRTTPARLVRELRGDLGAIVLEALRVEPERRYASVGRMIEDVERHLAGRTVAARPETLAYRARTFVRRHPVPVVLGVLLFVTLAVFSAYSAIQSERLAAERDRANREAEIAGEVSAFLTDLFRRSDPNEARGEELTAREILDRGRGEIDQRVREPSLVRARLKRTLGKVYENLGEYREALPLYEAALATATELGGEDGLEAVAAKADLARLFLRMGWYEESEALAREALAVRRERLGEDHPATLDLLGNLATLRFLGGEIEEAEQLLRDAYEARRRVQGPDHPDTLGAATNLAAVLFNLGRLEEVEELYREIHRALENQLGPDHPRTLGAASNLGSVWVQLDRLDEAEELLRDVIERRIAVLGEDHPATLTAQSNLAGAFLDGGKLAEAEALYRRVLEGRREALGAEHPSTVDALYDVADVVALDPERKPEALELYRQVLDGYRLTRGPESRRTRAVEEKIERLAEE